MDCPHDTSSTHGGDNSLAEQTELHGDQEETAHFNKVCESYRQYAAFSRAARHNQKMRIEALDETQRRLLPPSLQPGTSETKKRDEEMKNAEIKNQFLLDMILRHAGRPISQDKLAEGSERVWSSDEDMSKVSSVLKSLARDWSDEGKIERDQAYIPVINAFLKYLPVNVIGSTSSPRLVVPGAGVGRLALELCSRGYAVQGNEFSFQMLLASDFILNFGCSPEKAFQIYPYLTETCNVRSHEDLVAPVCVPDCDPMAMLIPGGITESQEQPQMPDFSMAAGDFCSIYKNPRERGQWDGIASCFFLDTAPVVVEYLQIMYDMLREGGLLINFGPLLWHFNGPSIRPGETMASYTDRLSHLDSRYLQSIDMTYDDVKTAMNKVGFEIIEEREGQKSYYTANPRSMKKNEYSCVFFVARKIGSRG